MARIRTIKPDFWTDEKLTECSVSARLLFIGLLNFADDSGNLSRSAKKIKMQVFPADAFDCEPLICELLTHGVLTEYSVSGEKYLQIKGFTKHQVINRPTKSNIPPPESPKNNEPSNTTHGGLTEDSWREGKGREGKGKEIDTHYSPPAKAVDNFAQGCVSDDSKKPKPKPSPAEEICQALESVGIGSVSPNHPELLVLIDKGVGCDLFVDAGRKAREKGKGFSYMLGILKGQMAEANAVGGAPGMPDAAWDLHGGTIRAKAAELGMLPWAGDEPLGLHQPEPFSVYTDRVRARIESLKVAA